MKNSNNKNIPNSRPRNISHKCDSCGLVSKQVNKSIKFNNYLCIECFLDKVISINKEK